MTVRMTQQIRESIAASIKALAKYTTYSYDRSKIKEDQLPAVTVSIDGGTYEDGAELVSVDVRIKIKDKGLRLEDILDNHAENYIEPLFPIGNTLNGLIEYIKPTSFTYLIDDDSDVGSMILNYNVKYDNEG